MMFNQSVHRVGFACKYMHPDQSLPVKRLREIEGGLTETTTTKAWMERQTAQDSHDKLWSIIQHNTQAAYNLVQYISGLPHGQRMVRLGSNQLPFYTLDPWRKFYTGSDVREFLARQYRRVGDLAREHDVRLSMHPGQFCCLASNREDVVIRSLEEFEYHATLIRWMGYGQKFQDFKCNVHVSGRNGVDGIKKVLPKLSTEALNTITFENDEFNAGIDDILELAEHTALVFDNHHHFIHSHEHLKPSDDRYKRIIDSWRGIRPAMHYSISREEYLVNTPTTQLPIMSDLLAEGFKRGKLRAHSNFYTNNAMNDLVHEFTEFSDVMCESKMKNISSLELFNYLQKHT